MSTLEDRLLEIKQEGFALESEKSDTVLSCDAVTDTVREHGRYATRRLLANEIQPILDITLQRAVYIEDKVLYDHIMKVKERYAAGDSILIEGLLFYSPESAGGENPYLTGPIVNNIGNGIVLSSIPISAAGMVSGSETLKRLGKGAIPLGMSVKLFEKAYKEYQKDKKDYTKIAKYTAGGVGGLILASGVALSEHPLHKYILTPLVAAYGGMASGLFQRLLKRGTSLYEPMPPFNTVSSDLREQAGRYADATARYAQGVELLNPKELQDLVKQVNVFLKHHLEGVKLRDVDIDLDLLVSRAYGLLNEGASVPNKVTSTVEFAYQELGKLTPAQVAYDYVSSVIFMDNEENNGRIRSRADEVMEDLAVYLTGKGYDLELEKTRLESIAYTFADLRKAEMEAQGMGEAGIRVQLHQELGSAGLDNELTGWALERVYPPAIGKGVDAVSELIGNPDPQGYVTHYKLMKAKKVL